MRLENLAQPTATIRAGMSVGDFMAECVRSNVRGLPYVDGAGRVVGRLSIRHCFRETCIPDFVVKAAHVLGDAIQAVNIPPVAARDILDRPVEPLVLDSFAHAGSNAPVMKALAIMEQLNTSYLFVIDEGKYRGIVTHMAIAGRMLAVARESDAPKI